MMVNADEWLLEKANEIFTTIITAPLEYIANLGLNIIPDVTGYIMMACGAFVYLNAMTGRGINGPLGFAAATAIGSTSVLAVV